ncbi:selenocysteine-specific translation elongation factor [Actinopolyspora mortivallis]|uniref:Selenocysteine-specific translation elongation factor n=1 Tax=Actinopolyspora mortivallis TaxID=33906 RepID=A0A2T0GS65_ACTMO|nr:selenocysteine-specific translation elongation factor [Actinopolyspora mortivallis]PRW61883.1 selenocysteine-specific translation elongation factor [Actinopolyspora mortivallis]
MRVIATAGHVDHGKSTLVAALTGTDPDRWGEEKRRGLTIDLGFAWTQLPSGETLVFVDVPGHRRFVGNMLAGVGEIPAVLFVVAADEGWMPQSEEHLQALHALGVEHGVLAITRSDLAEPRAALRQARRRLEASTLAGIPAVTLGAGDRTGTAELVATLERVVRALPEPRREGEVRVWLDRVFTIRGAGTVATATLPSGELSPGTELELARTGRRTIIRDLHTLGERTERVRATARVALNLRGLRVDELRRGDALITPGAWWSTDTVDARLSPTPPGDLPRELTLHIGSATAGTRIRPLGGDTTRLSLDRPLPLRVGDRALLRDPGRNRVPAGVTVLDVHPPPLRRRGAARARARELDDQEHSVATSLLRRHGALRLHELRAMGLAPPAAAHRSGQWLLDPRTLREHAESLLAMLERRRGEQPLSDGLTDGEALRALGLPDRALLDLVLTHPRLSGVSARAGRLCLNDPLCERLPPGIAALRDRLRSTPFDPPTAGELRELGLGRAELGAATTAGELLKLAENVYLLPDAPRRAAHRLAVLPSPFTPAQAREALRTTRRVVVPLLERLRREGYTLRLPDGTHRIRRLDGPER